MGEMSTRKPEMAGKAGREVKSKKGEAKSQARGNWLWEELKSGKGETSELRGLRIRKGGLKD